MERLLSIGRFARLTHLSLKALRLYDQRGLRTPALIDVHTGRRYYRPEQLSTAQLIRRLRTLELPLDDIGTLLATREAGDTSRLLERHRQRIEGWLAADTQALRALAALADEWAGNREEGSLETKVRRAHHCSFCGKTQAETQLIIAGHHGDGPYICRECVGLCNEMITAHEQKAAGA